MLEGWNVGANRTDGLSGDKPKSYRVIIDGEPSKNRVKFSIAGINKAGFRKLFLLTL